MSEQLSKVNGSEVGSAEAENDLITDDVSLSSMQPVISSEEHEGRDKSTDLNSTNDSDSQAGKFTDVVLERYQVACQKGDLETVKEMVGGGLIDLSKDHDDGEGVTGLHWASINNRLSIVDYLLASGADVNARAGTLHAPPIHWAARYGYVYIVHHLLKHGADPTLTDDQGFNILHISVNSSNIMLVLYILFFIVDKAVVDVDSPDPHGRTPMLWAAYQGDSLTVDALLRFGAYVKKPDQGGFTPFHWGTLKGQPHVLMYLIQHGADFFQKTNDGKDCFVIAQEMNTVYSLTEALKNCGFDSQGYPIKTYFSKSLHAKTATFLAPWIFLGVAFFLFSGVHPLFSFPVVLILGLAVQVALKRFVLPSYRTKGVSPLTFMKTPIFAGIFSGSVFWVVVAWVLKVLPMTVKDKPFANLALLLLIGSLSYLFLRLLKSDPGRVPAETDHAKVRETIEGLLDIGKFDTRHFCIETWVRKPLRSRFSSFSKSLVARFDHYCPWVYNDVGLKTHKSFLFFIACMELAVWLFAYICLEYFDELEDYYEDQFGRAQCFLFSDDDLCAGLKYDLFTFLVLAWALFQAIWVGFLVLVQIFQVFNGITNYEFGKLMKESKGRPMDPIMFNEFFNTTPDDFGIINGDAVDGDAVAASNQSRPNVKNSRKCFGVCCALTGIDQWVLVMRETMGIARGNSGANESLARSFPTNYGWKRNLRDFFLTSDVTAPLWQRFLYSPATSKALLGGKEVDYYKLFELPPKATIQSDQLDV